MYQTTNIFNVESLIIRKNDDEEHNSLGGFEGCMRGLVYNNDLHLLAHKVNVK